MKARNILVHPLSLIINTQRGKKIINVRRIMYIKGRDKCSLVYFDKFKYIKANHLLKWFEERLPKQYFIRCHKSYIVNCHYIDFFCSDNIILIDSENVKLSKNYKSNFQKGLSIFVKNTFPD